ncbi:hypothetical protein [Achromobacter sp. SLBN-14]|uniref:hypothetical protein n=1 Tax=Achromobacter sp. SLBN-14 TaxID=2768442 RepID=UPI001150051B|nr:hypothetical protein [Achromobacter sp. SLBN-14]TQJ97611.1 hypothetical protein FBY20_4413 [Achromobacter sp. SLBN-14]
MSFGISLGHETSIRFGGLTLWGKVEIDEYTEDFLASVDFWSRDDYLRSWKRSLSEGLCGGERCALITSMHDPASSNFLFYWAIYFEGEVAYLQNSVLFLSDLVEDFDPNSINRYVAARLQVNDDGVAISQWSVSRRSVLSFYETL